MVFRAILPEFYTVWVGSVDFRLKTFSLHPQGVHDLPGFVIDDLNHRVGLGESQFGEPALYRAPIILGHIESYRPAWELGLISIGHF